MRINGIYTSQGIFDILGSLFHLAKTQIELADFGFVFLDECGEVFCWRFVLLGSRAQGGVSGAAELVGERLAAWYVVVRTWSPLCDLVRY